MITELRCHHFVFIIYQVFLFIIVPRIRYQFFQKEVGGGLLPINRVIGMCCWIGVAFSRHGLTIMGLHFQLSY